MPHPYETSTPTHLEGGGPIGLPPSPRTREPYVGHGADGARRSAQIDLSEADTYDPGPDRDRCLASAARWQEQAELLESLATARRP